MVNTCTLHNVLECLYVHLPCDAGSGLTMSQQVCETLIQSGLQMVDEVKARVKGASCGATVGRCLFPDDHDVDDEQAHVYSYLALLATMLASRFVVADSESLTLPVTRDGGRPAESRA
jgi:hypothetical protein